MSGLVIVLNTAPAEPVYHEFADAVWDDAKAATVWHTVCGQVVRYDWIAAKLPEVHAAKFARPCRRCYEVTS